MLIYLEGEIIMNFKDSLEKKAKSTLIKTGVELLEKNPEKKNEKSSQRKYRLIETK